MLGTMKDRLELFKTKKLSKPEIGVIYKSLRENWEYQDQSKVKAIQVLDHLVRHNGASSEILTEVYNKYKNKKNPTYQDEMIYLGVLENSNTKKSILDKEFKLLKLSKKHEFLSGLLRNPKLTQRQRQSCSKINSTSIVAALVKTWTGDKKWLVRVFETKGLNEEVQDGFLLNPITPSYILHRICETSFYLSTEEIDKLIDHPNVTESILLQLKRRTKSLITRAKIDERIEDFYEEFDELED